MALVVLVAALSRKGSDLAQQMQAFVKLDHKADAEEGDHSLIIFVPDPDHAAENASWAFDEPGLVLKFTGNAATVLNLAEGQTATITVDIDTGV